MKKFLALLLCVTFLSALFLPLTTAFAGEIGISFSPSYTLDGFSGNIGLTPLLGEADSFYQTEALPSLWSAPSSEPARNGEILLLQSLLTTGEESGVEVGAFVVSGDASGYSYASGTLTFTKGGSYSVANKDPQTPTTDVIVVDVGVGNSINITLNGVNIAATVFAPFTITSGDITILLADENILQSGIYSHAGLEKNSGENESLLITSAAGNGSSNGQLSAKGGANSAGIGGGKSKSVSNITIAGGTIEACLEEHNYEAGGAGIGGGSGGNGKNISISGGTVSATGGNGGAGIGGGDCGNGSNITISGSTVNATAHSGGAGIGGGYKGNGSDININSGKVIAVAEDYGAGIGGGFYGAGSNITISGGEVKAKSEGQPSFGGGAGIGGGFKGNGSNIMISGGTVTATGGGQAAGIGGSYQADGSDITISGGTVTATGTCQGAGIGGGLWGEGKNIRISGGTVTATGNDSAGIGGGWLGDGNNITISGGSVTATGSGGGAAGIGGGGGYARNYSGDMSGSGSNITISGGIVVAKGGCEANYGSGAGIGSGPRGETVNVIISGGTVTAIGGENADGIGKGENGTASNIQIIPAADSKIYARVGSSENDAEALDGSPFMTSADITELVKGKCYFDTKTSKKQFLISGLADPFEGGTVSGTGYYEPGSTVTLYAQSNVNYIFRYWMEDGVILSTERSYSFTAEGDRTLTAVFAKLPPQIHFPETDTENGNYGSTTPPVVIAPDAKLPQTGSISYWGFALVGLALVLGIVAWKKKN